MNIKNYLKTQTLKDISVTTGGTFINGVLGMLFFIFIGRLLGPEQFGLLSVSIAVLTLIGDIADFGINTGLINFVSKHFKDSPSQAFKFLKLGLEAKVIVWLVILPIGWVLAPWVGQNIFQKNELVTPLRLMMLGVGGSLLFSFVTNSLQALGRFWSWSILTSSTNALRLLAVVFLLFSSQLSLPSVIVVYISVLFFGFFAGLLLMPLKFVKAKDEWQIGKEFFHYNKWIALFVVLAALASRMDSFISARLLTAHDLGIYAAALQLSAALPQLVFAIAASVAPKIAAFRSDQEAYEYLKKLQKLVCGLAAVILLSLPLSILIIPFVYGSDYTSSILPFIIIMIGQIIFLISIPVHQSIFYYFQKPSLFVLVASIHLSFAVIGGWVLISWYGIIGAALTVLIGNILDFIIPAIWVIKKFKNKL